MVDRGINVCFLLNYLKWQDGVVKATVPPARTSARHQIPFSIGSFQHEGKVSHVKVVYRESRHTEIATASGAWMV